jgi:hypothetical protein
LCKKEINAIPFGKTHHAEISQMGIIHEISVSRYPEYPGGEAATMPLAAQQDRILSV